MGTVRLEVVPWLTDLFGADRTRRLTLEVEVAPGERMADFLGRLVQRHPRLKKVVFDPEQGVLVGYANIFVNQGRVTSEADLEVILNEGDNVVMLPAYVGGSSGLGLELPSNGDSEQNL